MVRVEAGGGRAAPVARDFVVIVRKQGDEQAKAPCCRWVHTLHRQR